MKPSRPGKCNACSRCSVNKFTIMTLSSQCVCVCDFFFWVQLVLSDRKWINWINLLLAVFVKGSWWEFSQRLSELIDDGTDLLCILWSKHSHPFLLTQWSRQQPNLGWLTFIVLVHRAPTSRLSLKRALTQTNRKRENEYKSSFISQEMSGICIVFRKVNSKPEASQCNQSDAGCLVLEKPSS